MRKNKSSISKGSSDREIGEYWDSHDLSCVWDKTRKVKFDVNIESETSHVAVEKSLVEKCSSRQK